MLSRRTMMLATVAAVAVPAMPPMRPVFSQASKWQPSASRTNYEKIRQVRILDQSPNGRHGEWLDCTLVPVEQDGGPVKAWKDPLVYLQSNSGALFPRVEHRFVARSSTGETLAFPLNTTKVDFLAAFGDPVGADTYHCLRHPYPQYSA